MNNAIFIPQKIRVGFQKRSDTYTKKLAYVIYYDENGTLRKAGSWESWRDKKIEPVEYDNTPMEGFVLNKKVGGYSGDWGISGRRMFEYMILAASSLKSQYLISSTSWSIPAQSKAKDWKVSLCTVGTVLNLSLFRLAHQIMSVSPS